MQLIALKNERRIQDGKGNRRNKEKKYIFLKFRFDIIKGFT
jgi:hypothetical protein